MIPEIMVANDNIIDTAASPSSPSDIREVIIEAKSKIITMIHSDPIVSGIVIVIFIIYWLVFVC